MLCAVLHPRSSRLSGWVLGVQGAGGAGCNAGVMRCAARPSGAKLAWLCFMCNALGSSPGLRLHKKQTAALKTKRRRKALSLCLSPPPPHPLLSGSGFPIAFALVHSPLGVRPFADGQRQFPLWGWFREHPQDPQPRSPPSPCHILGSGLVPGVPVAQEGSGGTRWGHGEGIWGQGRGIGVCNCRR